MKELEQLKIYNELKKYLSKIIDKKTKNLYIDAIKLKCINCWGYCPDNTQYKSMKKIPELNAYEENLLKRIKMAKEYGYFERDEKIEKEFKARMKEFITKGGKWNDLPKDLQNEFILKSYLGTIYEQIEDCINFLENN